MAEHLRRTFVEHRNVAVVHGDVLEFEFPGSSWRAFGNLPFSKTTAILRRLLDDPATHLERADLLVQFEAARKRAAAHPATLVSLGWLPWWDFSLPRAIPAMAFDPAPSVDAGLLVVRRRSAELLDRSDRTAYLALIAQAFARGGWPVRRSLASKIAQAAWRRIARERGLAMDARPSDLDVWDWVAVFGATRPPC
jgi:23S rRNA (adenine-N6)-dimethyltransferase